MRLILDIIEYTQSNDIPGALILLDIEKAFDSVNHDFFCFALQKNTLTSELLLLIG